MRSLLILSLTTAVFLDDIQPKTSYTAERELLIESECTLDMSQVVFEIVRDGEPMEMPDRGDIGSSETRTVTIRETIGEVDKEGAPTQALRAFEAVEVSSVQTMGDEEFESEREGRLHEVTLALKIEDDEIVCEVEDGVEPDEEEALEGHKLGLALDFVLPTEEVGEGATWELDNDAVRAILGLDVESALFGGRPGTPEGGEGGRGGRGGRGRRGWGGGSRSGGFSKLVQAEWEGEATLESVEEDLDGVKCCVIALSFEASGEYEPPQREWGGGGRRGGRALELSNFEALVGVTYEAELEGKLWFAIEENHPAQLEIEGDVSVISETVREFGDSSMEIYSESEGELELTVTITEE